MIGEIDDQRLSVVARMLMAIRDYLGIRHAVADGKVEPIQDWEMELYMRILKQGLFVREPAAA